MANEKPTYQYTITILQHLSTETQERKALKEVFGNWSRVRDLRCDADPRYRIEYTCLATAEITEKVLDGLAQFLHEATHKGPVTITMVKLDTLKYVEGIAFSMPKSDDDD